MREVCPCSTVLAPSLSDYGYREGTTEEEGAPPFSFGSNRWGSCAWDSLDQPLQMRYVPRSMIFADPGVEGLEWFVGSDLSQWELQLAGRRGQGRCPLEPSQDPPGLALSISPLWSANTPSTLPSNCAFDFYLAVPILEGHAQKPWLHTSFNRNRGDWVSAEEIQRWAERGIQTVHCHNDGDYYDDGLFWRDGSYPPYPDMDRYDKVIADCRQAGHSHRDLLLEQGAAPEHQGVPGTRRRPGAGRTARATSSTTSSAARANSAPRCASAPAGSSS